jgi:hypothetical protein
MTQFSFEHAWFSVPPLLPLPAHQFIHADGLNNLCAGFLVLDHILAFSPILISISHIKMNSPTSF